MKEVSIFKAQPIGDQVIDSVVIRIEDVLPEYPHQQSGEPFNAWRTKCQAELRKQAETLADALCESLPQGVISELTAELLERQACIFRGTI